MLQKIKRLLELQKINNWSQEQFWQAYGLNDEASYILLQNTMFINTIISSASSEQMKKWMPLLQSMSIIGVYAQTELGHGSNVQKLETTATYVPETQEWEINSPYMTASKWWIGGIPIMLAYTVCPWLQRLLFLFRLGEGGHALYSNGSVDHQGQKLWCPSIRYSNQRS